MNPAILLLVLASVDVIQDDGAAVTPRRNTLNFIGHTCADDAANNRTNCTPPAGAPDLSAEDVVTGSSSANLSAERVATDTASVDVDTGTGGQMKWNVLPAGVTLTGDVDGAANANDLDEAAVESELESVLDVEQLQGALAGDVDGAPGSTDIDEAAVETELEGVIDLPDLQGILTVAKGGNGAAPGGDDQVFVSSSASAGAFATLPDCDGDATVLHYDQSTNAFSCGDDDTGAATQQAVPLTICPPGAQAVAGICHTFTNLPASFVEVGNSASRTFFDVDDYTEFRIVVSLSVAAVTGNVQVHCDTDAAFGSPTTLGTINDPGATITAGAWTAIGAGECLTAGGVNLRAGMTGGNTTEDPAVRRIEVFFR